MLLLPLLDCDNAADNNAAASNANGAATSAPARNISMYCPDAADLGAHLLLLILLMLTVLLLLMLLLLLLLVLIFAKI